MVQGCPCRSFCSFPCQKTLPPVLAPLPPCCRNDLVLPYQKLSSRQAWPRPGENSLTNKITNDWVVKWRVMSRVAMGGADFDKNLNTWRPAANNWSILKMIMTFSLCVNKYKMSIIMNQLQGFINLIFSFQYVALLEKKKFKWNDWQFTIQLFFFIFRLTLFQRKKN